MDFRQEKNFLTNVVIYLTFFLLWVWLTYLFFDYKEKNLVLKNVDTMSKTENSELNMDKFYKVYRLLKKNYYDFDEVEKNDLEEATIVWLVNWVWDPYTEYFNEKENKTFSDSLSWNFEWIWAVLEKNEFWVKIMSVVENSPAKEWDLRIWDIIFEVNSTDVSNMSTYEVVNLIKWPAWKEVNLKIFREEEILEKKLFTRAIVIPSISSEDFWEIWYISMSTFGEKTAIEFQKELKKFKNKNWIIIDLRQNWWGYLEIAMDILSNFIKKWEVLALTKYSNWLVDKYYSHWVDEIYNWKIVILIDKGSASASEIVAWAMKDYSKAILVWEKSYWKGSVQNPISLSDWSMIKITTAKWFTPNDKNIDKEWIFPDIEIIFEKEDIENKYDRQLEEAKKVLNSFIENNYLQLSIDKYLEKK